MANPFIGQIMMVGFNFAPRGWAFCDGQLLAISSNTALFSLIGTTYGGDGRTSFGLPDLRGRSAKHVGQGPGLQRVSWGQRGGREDVTLSVFNMPPHSHPVANTLTVTPLGNSSESDSDEPTGAYPGPAQEDVYAQASDVQMAPAAVGGSITLGNTGNGQSFNIENPFLGIYHVIALVGLFPSRN